MGKKIFIVLDYHDYFYSSYKRGGHGLDVDLIRHYFAEYGYDLTIKRFREIDFRRENYRGQYILYQSFEDPGLHYKSYIEDILLGLQIQGAILIPDFYLFRVDDNKLFMEILRDISGSSKVTNIRAKGYGTYEDFLEEINLLPAEVVLKSSTGSKSTGVRLARNNYEKRKYAEQLSRSCPFLPNILKNLFGHYYWKLKCRLNYYPEKPYLRQSTHRDKFIVQDFIPNLDCDYKVLVYGHKYYVSLRWNRKNDFRASGSGLHEFPECPPAGLLDYADSVFKIFETPYISLDIAFDEKEFYVLEFQFVRIGSGAMEKSPFYFIKQNGEWMAIPEKPILEREVVRSVVEYIERQTPDCGFV